MWFVQRHPRKSSRPVRVARGVRPTLEGFEPRLLLSNSGIISGTVSKDLTGNGFSSDDKAESGVTIQLLPNGSSTPLTTTSDSNGNYSFSKLAPGAYSVQEVLPNGHIQTGGLSGYSVTVQNGKTYANNNFDNFLLYPTPTLSAIRFTVTAPNGSSQTYSNTLGGHVAQGDTVTASFVLDNPGTEKIELVSYVAPNGNFGPTDLQKDVIFDEQETYATSTTSSAPARETATVNVPNGDFELDFIVGPAIDHFATNANITYQAQDRLLDSQQGGTQANGPSSISGTVSTPAPAGQKTGTGIAGVTVVLTGWNYKGQAVSLHTVTDANGHYTFSGLVASDCDGYTLTNLVPTGYTTKTKLLGVFLNTNTNATGLNFVDAPKTT